MIFKPLSPYERVRQGGGFPAQILSFYVTLLVIREKYKAQEFVIESNLRACPTLAQKAPSLYFQIWPSNLALGTDQPSD